MWKKVLREYFAFPKKERRAIWVLFILWIILLCVQVIQSNFFNYQNTYSYKVIVNNELTKSDENKLREQYKNRSQNTFFKKKLYFNYISLDDLVNAGITKNQAYKIISSKEKGIKIYTIEDVEKLIDVDSVSKNIIKNILSFYPSKKYFNINPTHNNTNKPITNININTADTSELDLIRGISFATASRVLRYKERLGGYINKEQFKEVWGMDSNTYEILIANTMIEQHTQKQLNINKADLKTLGSHPYIGYKLAKLIVNYRTQHGDYVSVRDLLKIHVMNEEIFSKIEAYISISDDK
jgi:DNA uptake protein ComE-like DNA-binding protein